MDGTRWNYLISIYNSKFQRHFDEIRKQKVKDSKTRAKLDSNWAVSNTVARVHIICVSMQCLMYAAHTQFIWLYLISVSLYL